VTDFWFASFDGHKSSFSEEMTLVGGEQVLRVYYEHTFDTNTWAKKCSRDILQILREARTFAVELHLGSRTL